MAPWEGTDQRLNRKATVKLIRRFEASATRRFYREARITARLSHPGGRVRYRLRYVRRELCR